MTCIYAQTTIHTQIRQMMQSHIDDLTDSKVTAVGDTLESALEFGEKHEAFAMKCKEVRVEGVRGEEVESERGGGWVRSGELGGGGTVQKDE